MPSDTKSSKTKSRKGENVKTHRSAPAGKQAISAELQRTTLTSLRDEDFVTRHGLTLQTACEPSDWPAYIIKELADNALDDAEDNGRAPVLDITVDATGICVADNGSGLPPETIAGALDFSKRVSSKAAYVAPDRGRQGNALKTLLPMPYALDGDNGRAIVRSRGEEHIITCSIDPISHRVIVTDQTRKCKNSGRRGE